MPYIGNKGSVAGFVNQPSKQDLTGASGGTLTLTHSVSGPEDISLFINNVRQEPTTSYTATGTTVTLQGYTVAASDDIYVLYNGLTHLSSVPADGSVSTAKIADNSVTSAKLATGAVFTPSYAVISDQKSSGTAGGTSSTSLTTRDLNTVVFDPDNIVTVASNQFTLIAGTYILEWSSPCWRSNSAFSVIYDVTASAIIATSTGGYSIGTANTAENRTEGIARVVITSNNIYELRMKVSAARTGSGFGLASNADPETFSVVKITKIA
mgnify:CR=1 FL=1